MKAIDILHEISGRLAPCGIAGAEREAGLFISEGLDIDPVRLYRDNPDITEEQAIALREMARRRSRREPLQYILGCTDFAGLEISVGPGVLIPRPETELMAEYAVKALSAQGPASGRQRAMVLDLCTGSGCLALALAKAFPDSRVFGVDISETALGYARENARLNGTGNVQFLRGHLFEPLRGSRLFDLIISNPPYIKTSDINGLQPEVRDWEPISALDGGEDGLDFYREIIPSAGRFLRHRGILMLELGAGSAEAVAGMFGREGYGRIQVFKDYAGIKRVIQAEWTR
ncbi:MAG: peptide chain release factor N(5)-glutamine methyltransferase [Deferribacteres bacterium]|nr:peptide chain release factor N(5)-glutamine methyltransferase [Deferribacteres bacterium]